MSEKITTMARGKSPHPAARLFNGLLRVLVGALLAAAAGMTLAQQPGDPMRRVDAADGYLPAARVGDIKQWLPPAPAPRSAAQREDVAVFRMSRQTLASGRGQQAAEDDVFDPAAVAARFSEAAGIALTPTTAPTLMKLIKNMGADARRLTAPVKLSLKDGGRIRPFVAYPKAPSCLKPRDMAGHRDEDLVTFHLDQSGSYPSTHALVGLLMAMVLGETIPARADAVMVRGLEFGNSRIICGFHYYSDVVAGRLVASTLYARLHADPVFSADMLALRGELQAAGAPN
jgi:acid phosphatase (class A)